MLFQNSKIVNMYAKIAVVFAIAGFALGVLTFVVSGQKFAFPPVEKYEEFTYDMAISSEFMFALSIDVRKQYFSDIHPDSFEEERLHLYNIYEKDVKQGRLKETVAGIVFMVLFWFVFMMHRRLVHHTGGWKRKE